MIVLIPAYKPNNSLLRLAHQLKARSRNAHLLVIDDGSGSEYAPIFTELSLTGATVITHPANLGKGAALRTGLNWVRINHPQRVVVSADADGQHLPRDIFAVAARTQTCAASGQRALVLGVRTLPGENTAGTSTTAPARSAIGNALTVGFFTLATGKRVADTQTGLRGFTPAIIDWALGITGNKYEYEFTMLLYASRAGVELVQVPIEKVYEPGNPTSHFRPVRDSVLIYAPLLGFLASSLTGFMIDAVVLFALVAIGAPLLLAVVAARVSSALVNFSVNRMIMRDGLERPSPAKSLVRYAVLAVGILVVNAALLEVLLGVGAHLVVAKILTEAVLIPASFAVQRRWVFLPARQPKRPAYTAQKNTQTHKVSLEAATTE